MKNNLSLVCENRLKQVLVMDKQISPALTQVIKSEVLLALKNYMEINAEELFVSIDMDQYGFYEVCLQAKVRRLIPCSYLPE